MLEIVHRENSDVLITEKILTFSSELKILFSMCNVLIWVENVLLNRTTFLKLKNENGIFKLKMS